MEFLDYLGKEKENLLISLLNFKAEFDFFDELDKIFLKPLGWLTIKREDLKEFLISQLYLFVHFHLYFSVSCLLRTHLSEGFSSLRKAIDAALCAYKIILEPETAKKYLDRDKYFQHIKANIQREIEKNTTRYPLAHRLVKVHHICSEYGSHADVSSLFHRLEVRPAPEIQSDRLFLQYFQFPRDVQVGRYYFVIMLLSFLYIFDIFKTYFDSKTSLIDPYWQKDIEILRQKLLKLGKGLSYLIRDEDFFSKGGEPD